MACKKCNNCNDNGCKDIVYPECLITKTTYSCLGVPAGSTGADVFNALEAACLAGWGGGNLTFNNGLTKTGTLVQLGGTLVKNTSVDLGTLYSLILAGNFGAGTVNGINIDPNGNGPGNPATGIATRDLTNNIGSQVSTAKAGLIYYATLEAINTGKEATVDVNDQAATIKYSSTGGGANYRKVRLDATGIIIDGVSAAGGLPTMLDQTQMQETISITPNTPLLVVTTDANTYEVTGAGTITRIDSTPAVGTIQPGTKITLEFNTPGAIVQHDTTGAVGDGVILHGCVDFVASAADTLTLVCREYTPGGSRYWNEIGRKQCYVGFETWKTLDAVGTMMNGEPIPTAAASFTAFVARLRHQDLTHVEIQLTGSVSVGAIGATTMFTLPATAGSIAYRPAVPLAYNITGMNTTTGVPYTGQLQITAGGAVNFTVQDVIPPGAAEDHSVALVISIPLD